MKKEIINSEYAPAAVGPYSQAIAATGTMLFVSGQLPLNPENGKAPEALADQVAQSMDNILAIVAEAGGSADNLVKCGLFIRDMSRFSEINGVYEKYFVSNPPARFVVEVSALPKGVDVEIDAIAVL